VRAILIIWELELFNKLHNFCFVITLLIFIFSNISAQTIIQDLQFSGLQSTNKEYLLNYLKCKIGKILDTNVVQEDQTFLRNSQYFSDADYSIKTTGKYATIVFYVKEKKTLLPIFNFNIIKSNYFIQLGAVEYNLLGKWDILGGYYQYYDRSSFSLFSELKNIFETRLGIIGRYNKISTTEPAYFNEGTTFYNVDKNSYEFLLTFDFSRFQLRNPKIIFKLGANYLEEKYYKNFGQSGQNSPGPLDDHRQKVIIKSSIAISSINYFYEFIDGYSFKTYYDVVSEKDDVLSFHQILSELKYKSRIFSYLNAAARIRIGVSTNKFSPFIPFFIDNYVNVRGAGDRVSRGSAELSLNLELRSSLFRNSWTALQMVNFIDYGSLRPGGDNLSSLFNKENVYSSTGLGLRIHLLNFFNAIFRLDYGITLHGKSKDFILFGFGHYF